MIRRKHSIWITVAGLGLTFALPVTSYGQQENRGSDRRDDARDARGLRGDEMKFNDLPADVQKAVRQELKDSEKITTVTKVQRANDLVYRVELEGRERSRALVLGKEGRILENSNMTDRGGDAVRLRDIPEAAQKAIRDQAKGSEVLGIEQITRNNESIYRARIKDAGADRFVTVGRDGRVQNINDRDDRTDGDRNNRADNNRADNNRRNDNNDVQDVRSKVAWNQVPEPVQRGIKEHTNGRQVEDIMKITHGDETWYRFRIDRPGDDRYMFIGKEGRVQHTARVADEDRQPVRLSDVRRGNDNDRRWEGWKREKVDPQRLPGEVKNALGKNEVKLNQLSDAWVNTRDGRTIYHVIERGPTRDMHYRVTAEGKFLGEDNVTEEGRDRVNYNDLPGPVKSTLAGYGKADDYRRVFAITEGNRTWYEARHENGDVYRVGRDGSIVSKEGEFIRSR